MTELNYFSIQELEFLIEFEYKGNSIDLHNAYDCVSIAYSKEEDVLTFNFEPIPTYATTDWVVQIEFSSTKILYSTFPVEDRDKSITLDSLYRVTFMEDGHSIEENHEGYRCFFLEFDEGQEMQLLSKSLIIRVFD